MSRRRYYKLIHIGKSAVDETPSTALLLLRQIMQLIHFDKARHELELASSVDEVKEIRDKAAAIKAYLKQAGESLKMQQMVAEIMLRAERKGGKLLLEMDAGEWGGDRKSEGFQVDQADPLESERNKAIKQASMSESTAKRWQRVARVDDDIFEEYIATKKSDEDEITRSGILSYMKRDLSAMMSSNSEEWYTSGDIIAAVVELFVIIDLDPCSNSHESPNVPANTHYTKDDNGLGRDWFGSVYVNPPYGTKIPLWVNKAIGEIDKGSIKQCVMLLPARPDTKWFYALNQYDRCFMKGRVKFNNHENSAPFPTMLVNIGGSQARFNSVMSRFGDIYSCTHLMSS